MNGRLPKRKYQPLRTEGSNNTFQRHIHTRVGLPEELTVVLNVDGQVKLATVPRSTQLVRRHRDWAEGGRRLGLEEAKTLGELREGEWNGVHTGGGHRGGQLVGEAKAGVRVRVWRRPRREEYGSPLQE